MRPAFYKHIEYTPGGTAYIDSGGGSDALVFIHGVGMNRDIWRPQLDYFFRSFRVISYDLPGHGNSSASGPNPCLEDYSRQLLELLDAVNLDVAALIGHSMGALVGIDFALDNPQRVRGLVAMNAVYCRSPKQRQAVLMRAETVLRERKIGGIDTTLARWFGDSKDPDLLAKISTVRQYLSQADPVGYGRTYRLFAGSDRVFEGRLEQLSMPVLYLTGGDDSNSTPAMSKKMAAQTSGGQAIVIDQEAHMMACISAGKINPVIEEFLTSLMKEAVL